jgi:hypothetical protein
MNKGLTMLTSSLSLCARGELREAQGAERKKPGRRALELRTLCQRDFQAGKG